VGGGPQVGPGSARSPGRLDSRAPGHSLDTQIARTWGELAGTAQLRGRPRPQNDTWIAACCLRYQVPLVTLNTADFTDFAAGHGLVLLGERM